MTLRMIGSCALSTLGLSSGSMASIVFLVVTVGLLVSLIRTVGYVENNCRGYLSCCLCACDDENQSDKMSEIPLLSHDSHDEFELNLSRCGRKGCRSRCAVENALDLTTVTQ